MAEEHIEKTELKISGMTCTTCITTIEKCLLHLDGVTNAQVNLGNEAAMVEYESAKLNLADLEKAVTDAGYRVVNEKIALKIGGMTCATCAKTIESALKKLDGISNVNVNLGAEKVYITYNPAMTTVAETKKAIEGAGYQWLGVEGEETEDLEKAAREGFKRKTQQSHYRVGRRHSSNGSYVCSSPSSFSNGVSNAGCFNSCLYLCKPSYIQRCLPFS